VHLPGARYPTGTQQVAFFNQVIDGIEQLPQVEAASAISFLPLDGLGAATSYTADDRPPPPDGQTPGADVRAVHHNYFTTMRIPVLKGRVFDGTEREDAEVFPIVISQAMAQTMWPEQEPIGKAITMPWAVDMHGEVIGVVADVRHMGLETAPRSKIYWSNTQFQFQFTTFVARTNVDPIGITAAAKEQVWIVDPDIPVSNIRTMDDRLGSSNAQRRFNMQLLGAFAAVALILACVGIYGVMSYAVAQRSHELGLRMALGAQPTQLLKMVIGKGMLLTAVAVGFGLAVAFGVTRAMTSLLFGVSAVDPVTFIGVALLLTGVAMAACWLPARRATRVDPIVALRSE
jgi:putative ABC transport system permease protein